MNPEQNNEAQAPAEELAETTAQAPIESTEPADLSQTPPVLEGVVPLTPEQEHAKQQEAQRQAQEEAQRQLDARRKVSLTKDSMEFLTRTQVTDMGGGYYRCGNRFLLSDSTEPFQSAFVQRVAVIHIGGQKALQYLAAQTVFTLDDYQKAFNGVPLEDEAKQTLLLNTVVAIIQATYNSVMGYIDHIFPSVGSALGANLEQLRIPAEKDGGKFQTVEALYIPIGARFRSELLIGVIIKYEGENNHYAISFTEFSPDPQTDEALDIRVFTDEVLGMRNRYIDQYILRTLPDLLAEVVGKVGDQILKPVPQPAQDAAVEAQPDGSAPTHEHHHGHQHHH
jgi:hypothetical protein